MPALFSWRILVHAWWKHHYARCFSVNFHGRWKKKTWYPKGNKYIVLIYRQVHFQGFSWENFNGKPWIFRWNIGVSIKSVDFRDILSAIFPTNLLVSASVSICFYQYLRYFTSLKSWLMLATSPETYFQLVHVRYHNCNPEISSYT